jgi:hypothetical protein
VLVQHHHRFRAIEPGGVEGAVYRRIDHFTHDLLLKLAGIVAHCRVFGHLWQNAATPVGARLAREGRAAVYLWDRAAAFAGKPRSYRGVV